MAKFGGSKESAARSNEGSENLTVIAAGTTFVGEVQSDGIVKVEGTVKGSVNAVRQVLVAKGGLIEGDVETREAVIGGRVQGGITASERVEVQSDSVTQGDIHTKRILVHEGGEVNGRIDMGAVKQKVAASQAAPAGVQG